MNIPKHHNSLAFITGIFLAVVLLVTAFVPMGMVQANGPLASSPLTTPAAIYGDSLAAGWANWSWDATSSLSNPSPVQSGSASISVTLTKAWGALYLHRSPSQSTTGYTHLQFYINGGTTGGQKLNIIANGNTAKPYAVTAPANTWSLVSVPLSSLGSPASLTDLYFQDSTGTVQSKFYIDSVALVDQSILNSPTATKTYVPMVTSTPTKPAPTATVPAPTATKPAPTATPGSTSKFTTLPPGSALPSDAQCAALVKARPENKRMNKTFNATAGTQRLSSNYFGGDDPRSNTQIAPRVDGNYTGTTDEILQWTACKWGIDEDIVRAQAAIESWWQQTTKGDWTTDATRCAPGHGLGVDGVAGQCPESFGILQNRYPYAQTTWPSMYASTAFNADMAYASWRNCYEGYVWWLNSVDRGSQYAAGDVWGCVGTWYAGRWHTAAADTYISKVKDYLSSRVWESASFQEP